MLVLSSGRINEELDHRKDVEILCKTVFRCVR